MVTLPIRIVPDPVLRQRAKRVSNIDRSILKLINNMTETMQTASGVGLAAPQIGISLRVIVIQIPGEEVIALINPQVVKRKGERMVVEGCLSVPGYQGEIKRSVSITVKGLEPRGKEVRLKADGLLSQALEHEIDHLDGILYTDHLESGGKLYRIEREGEDEAGKL